MDPCDELRTFQHWSDCAECGFHGLVGFTCRHDENYSDPDALGYMMDARCPACGDVGAVLVVLEQFQEMVLVAKRNRS